MAEDEAASRRDLEAMRGLLESEIAVLAAQMEGHWTLDIDRMSRLERSTDQRFAAIESATALAFSSQEKMLHQMMAAASAAVSKAETANERRFESVNEFRSQLSDQTRTFLPRSEFDRAHADILARLEASNNALAAKIDDLGARTNRAEGRSTGFGQSWAVLVAFVGMAATAIGVVIALH